MSLDYSATIAGAAWGSVRPIRDDRGAFRELWRESDFALADDDTGTPGARFAQANLSVSEAGVLRGLHYHRRQLDYWIVVAGRVFVALVDVRHVTMGNAPLVETRELAVDQTVRIPAGVAHGFLAIEPTQLLYLVTNEYDGSDELGFSWNDPIVAVPWPAASTTNGEPILSDRDRTNPPLRELLERIGSGRSGVQIGRDESNRRAREH